MLKTSAFYEWLAEEGLDPEMVEDDTEIVICCPLCQDTKPRLYISADTGTYICFHCHETGNLHQFLMRIGELDGSAAFLLGRDLTTDEYDDFDAPPRRAKQLPAQALTLPPAFIPVDHNAPAQFLSYLKKRGVSPALASARGLGYVVSGRYAWRVVVPVESDGRIYTYIARTILTQCPNCMESLNDCICDRKFPKVLTPLSKDGAAPSHTLYGLDAVRAASPSRIVVVEGVFDALRLPTEAVALMGSSISATQTTLLAGLARGRECILALDGDESGWKGAVKVAEALAAELINVKVALLPDGADPGSLPHDELEKYLHDALPYVL